MKKITIVVATMVAMLFAATIPAMAAEGSATKAKPAVKKAEGSAKASGTVLKVKFPKPMFIGTPKGITSDNLEPNPTKIKRKPILVPKDVTLISKGLSVKASDEEPIIGEVELITDSDKEGADGSYVEFGPGVQWVQIDLKKPSEIFAVAVWHYHAQGRVYKDVVIKCADDKDFITNVQQIFNNDHDNSAGLGVGKDKEYIETNTGRVLPAAGVIGRYVRLYSNGNTSNDMNHYIEVDVYGRVATEAAIKAGKAPKAAVKKTK